MITAPRWFFAGLLACLVLISVAIALRGRYQSIGDARGNAVAILDTWTGHACLATLGAPTRC